jgi:hypothetical protein
MPHETTDAEIDAMVEADLRDAYHHNAEVEALETAISHVSDPLVRRILFKIVELAVR